MAVEGGLTDGLYRRTSKWAIPISTWTFVLLRASRLAESGLETMAEPGQPSAANSVSVAPRPSWQPPARCPQCRGAQTRFIRMEYEASVYECEVCGVQFEAEE